MVSFFLCFFLVTLHPPPNQENQEVVLFLAGRLFQPLGFMFLPLIALRHRPSNKEHPNVHFQGKVASVGHSWDLQQSLSTGDVPNDRHPVHFSHEV